MPTPSYLDASRQDAGEADKDRHTPGPAAGAHRKYEARELVAPEFNRVAAKTVKQASNGAAVLRILRLFKGGDAGKYYSQGQAAHVASLMPGSKMTAADVNAAYKPYRDEVGKVVGAYAGLGAAGYGAHRAYDKAHAQSAWERMVDKAKSAYGEILG